jgi:phage baseplate assembly protein W
MRPDFGCPIHNHVFDSADASMIGLLGYEVRNSLMLWEPRIDVIDVVVSQDESQPSLLYIDISYQVRDANDPRNLVFPFYVIPDEE